MPPCRATKMARGIIVALLLAARCAAAEDPSVGGYVDDDDFAPNPNTLVIVTHDYGFYCFPKDECGNVDPLAGSRNTSGGSVLMGGGTDVDAAFEWQISRAGGGDFLVLRESGTDAYNPWSVPEG